ncbi:FBP domain-containing protein [Acaricomes phytoseiuli]|uniref:FBP domain-containing protein n=1 Tax=Acaricomes phytoseiuli TaxID=291968 RepID=UPI0005B8A67D|nr:FBP domain-containing protein [Acaricomes phytoseiuli]MCW1250468.1 FBP domain-containing protein [Acaricomes phytoseiuli]
MHSITPDEIRRSFINASRSEVKAITFPADLEQRPWDSLDYLGWRDPKMPQRGYLLYPSTSGLTGVLLRAPESGGRARKVLCELCRDVRSDVEALLYVARKSGPSGRDGNTVGTLICSGFQCSANARTEPPASLRPADPEAHRREQIAGLHHRLERFIMAVHG